MKLTLAQELELFTSIESPEWLGVTLEFQADPICALNRFRGNWQFTGDQLRRYLMDHPDLVESYFSHCAKLIGVHDKVVIVRKGMEYEVFDQDHGSKFGAEQFSDKIDAVMTWLQYRYMN